LEKLYSDPTKHVVRQNNKVWLVIQSLIIVTLSLISFYLVITLLSQNNQNQQNNAKQNATPTATPLLSLSPTPFSTEGFTLLDATGTIINQTYIDIDGYVFPDLTSYGTPEVALSSPQTLEFRKITAGKMVINKGLVGGPQVIGNDPFQVTSADGLKFDCNVVYLEDTNTSKSEQNDMIAAAKSYSCINSKFDGYLTYNYAAAGEKLSVGRMKFINFLSKVKKLNVRVEP
jgi:hypothetical protein